VRKAMGRARISLQLAGAIAAGVAIQARADAPAYNVTDLTNFFPDSITPDGNFLFGIGANTGSFDVYVAGNTLSSGVTHGSYIMPITPGVLGGMNDSYSFTGQAYFPANDEGAFVYSPAAGTTYLGSQLGSSSYGRCINDSGAIAGTISYSAGNNTTSTRGFEYANGTETIFNIAAGAANVLPNSINASGQVVGNFNTSINGSAPTHAFFYTPGIGSTDLGTLGGANSEAESISDAGEIVGGSQYSTDGTYQYHAVIFSAGNAPVDIGTLPGYIGSEAGGVNDAGEIVGVAALQDTANSPSHAFLYTPSGGMTDISSLLPASAATGEVPVGISNFGQIAMYTYGGNSTTAGYLLTPTTPVTSTANNSETAWVLSGVNYGLVSPLIDSNNRHTTAALLYGIASNNNIVTIAAAADTAGALASDAVTLSGTSGDTVVLSLSFDPSAAAALPGGIEAMRLGWLDSSTGQWENAVLDNTGGTPCFAGDGAYDPAKDFQLGDYGIDTADDTVWAVIDHNSEFGVTAVPEPASAGIMGVGALALLRRRRRV
jgi:probable HAF family extracellular repeat protein